MLSGIDWMSVYLHGISMPECSDFSGRWVLGESLQSVSTGVLLTYL